MRAVTEVIGCVEAHGGAGCFNVDRCGSRPWLLFLDKSHVGLLRNLERGSRAQLSAAGPRRSSLGQLRVKKSQNS